MRYNVEFRGSHIDAVPTVTSFDDPQTAIDYARQCYSKPHLLVRIHDTETSEFLTAAQLAYRERNGKTFGGFDATELRRIFQE